MEENKQEGPATTSTPAEQPKSKAGLVIVIILVIIVVLGVGGYFISRYIARKASEKLTEGIIKSTTGEDVNVDANGSKISTSDGTIAAGESAVWPKDMPSSVPEFKYGKIILAVKSENSGGWSVTYSDVAADALDKYSADLIKAGWAKDDTAELGFASAAAFNKDNYQIQTIYDPSSKGMSITVLKK